MVVFGKKFWGGFWRVLAPKVAVSDLKHLGTLQIMQRKEVNMKKIYRKIYLRLAYP